MTDWTELGRRRFLALAAVMGGSAALGPLAADRAWAQADPRIQLENEKYMKLYDFRENYFLNDPGWVDETVARVTWPEKGARIPPLKILLQSEQQAWIDAFRKFTEDARKVGLEYDIELVSQARWLEAVATHRHGDIEIHPAVLRPERVDPSEWLVSRAYGLDRRNYGEWTNEEYDAEVDAQGRESDPETRLKHVKKAQEILADDLYITQLGWGPQLISAYNSGAFENITPVRGFGIADFNLYHTYLTIKPKTARRTALVGATTLIKTNNLIGAGNRFRAIGRMIYDRLAFLDENLNVIPWAAESWEKVDDRTWDIKLRPGMTFHDGKPVTVEDLNFTLNWMMENERSMFWTANQFLESAAIQDAGAGVVRVTFNEPYGQFETYFLQLNVILPKHIWETILQDQNTDDPRRLRLDEVVGSGPFKWGRYRKDTELQLVANKDHFAAPNIDDLVIVVVPSVDGIIGRLQSGEIDFMDQVDLSPSQAEQLQGLDHVTVLTVPDLNWLHAVTRPSWLPWRDYEFRRAFHHMFDRNFLVKAVWEGAGRVPESNTFLVEGSPWHNADLPPIPEFDVEKARRILEEAGYAWDSDGRLTYPGPEDEAWVERVRQVTKDGYTWGGIKMIDREG